MIPKDYVMDEGVLKAIDAISRNESVIYLAGKAGVGKSTFIHYLKENCDKKYAIVCPTAVAALNVGGQTIHSFFRFKFGLFDKMDIKNRNDELINKLELLIIDEISMVRADIMDAIDYALRKWRKNKSPFGGLQILMVGDIYQLMPVVTNNEREIIYNRYKSPWFFDAKVFDKVQMYPIELKKIYRQNDKKFIELLHNIRVKKDVKQTIDILNRECSNKQKESALYITPTNAFANIVNRDMLNSLSGKTYSYYADRSGYLKLMGESLPVPEELHLKVGARVMIKKNIFGGINGDLGTIISCNKKSVNVELDRGGIIEVLPETWTTFKYEYNKESDTVNAVIVGKYTQVALTLGYASTFHKAQGISLDSIEIDFGNGCWSHGMAYIALSRCRKLETLSLTTPLEEKDVIIDDRIIEFHNEIFKG